MALPINQQAKVENLSRELMQDYLQQVGSDLAGQAPNLSLVELVGVIGGPEEAPFPLNVGLMMFNPEPWRWVWWNIPSRKSPITACKNIVEFRTERAAHDLPRHPHRRRDPLAGEVCKT